MYKISTTSLLFLIAVAVAAAQGPGASVYLVSSRATFEGGIEPLALSAIERVDSVGRSLVIAEIEAQRVLDVSLYVHQHERRCGGFFAFPSRAEAEAFVANDRTAQALGRSFVGEYTIDNHETVDPWLLQVQEPGIRSPLEFLSTEFPNRYYASTHGENAAVWIHDTWLGLAEGREDVSAELFTDCNDCGEQPSVILTIEGAELPEEIVVLGGHLDSISGVGDGDNMDAPGADDDASGIATLTEVLRVALASDWRPKRTVKFMGYAAEEIGLNGSQAIAQSFAADDKNVIGVLQLDMTNYAAGSDEAMRLMTDNSNPDLKQFMRDLFDEYLAPLGLTRGTYTCGYACSDHASWTQAGYPAGMMFEPTFNPRIHTPNDTLQQIGGTADVSVNFAMFGLAFLGELAKTAESEGGPTISIADRPEKEGNVGLRLMRFTLSLSSASDEPVTVDYATENDTAEAGIDYFAASGTVTFEPGETSAGIFVSIIPNTEVDGNRSFFVNLSDPAGATIDDSVAVGAIFDDDTAASGRSAGGAGVAIGDGE